MPGQRGRGRRWERRSAEHLEWLGKHYPDDAKKLIELKEKNEELYRKKIFASMRTYYRIERASRDENDELVKVLKETLDGPSLRVLYQPLQARQRLSAQITLEMIVPSATSGLAGALMLVRAWKKHMMHV